MNWNWDQIINLLRTDYWWIIPMAFAIYIAKEFSLTDVPRWFLQRNRDKLQFINEQIIQAEDLSPLMREHIRSERERIIIKITKGIDVSNLKAQKLIEISEDKPNGLRWPLIKAALPHLDLDKEGNLVVQISKWAWLFAGILSLPAIVCAGVYMLFGWLVIQSNNFLQTVLGIAIAVAFLIAAGWFLEPVRQIIAARRVHKHLTAQVTSASTEELIKNLLEVEIESAT